MALGQVCWLGRHLRSGRKAAYEVAASHPRQSAIATLRHGLQGGSDAQKADTVAMQHRQNMVRESMYYRILLTCASGDRPPSITGRISKSQKTNFAFRILERPTVSEQTDKKVGQ